MHFDILVEDQSGKKFLDILAPKIAGDSHTFEIIAYRGLGRLLVNLPKLLRGYGNTMPVILKIILPP